MYITTGCVVLPGNLHRDCHGRRLLCFILLMRYLFLWKEGGLTHVKRTGASKTARQHRTPRKVPEPQSPVSAVSRTCADEYNVQQGRGASVHVHASAPFDHAQHVWETSHSLLSAKKEGPEATNALVLHQ